jgi:hypothetical protein
MESISAHASAVARIMCTRILNGIAPGDLPVEFPTNLELVLNLNPKTQDRFEELLCYMNPTRQQPQSKPTPKPPISGAGTLAAQPAQVSGSGQVG